MRRNSMNWLVRTASSLLVVACLAACAEAQGPVGPEVPFDAVVDQKMGQEQVIFSGESFVAREDIIYRTVPQFRRLLDAALQVEPLQDALSNRLQEVRLLRLQVEQQELEIKSLRQALDAQERELQVYVSLSDAFERAFEDTNDALRREQERGGAWFVWGPTLGLGYVYDGEEGDFGAFVGLGMTYNVTGR